MEKQIIRINGGVGEGFNDPKNWKVNHDGKIHWK